MEKFKKWRKERRATANASRQTSQSEPPTPRYETDPPPEPVPTHVHRFGIKVLHDCPDPVVDICFIHGLTGDRDKTWTAIGQTTPWPKTLLPSKLDGRILTYGYNAHIAQKSVASSNRLIDHAQNLLGDLTADRGFSNASSRPLIFVAHSLGGLVCKKTILLSQNSAEPHSREIFNCLKGVVFMGTPHRGAWMADWAKIPASVFGIVKSTNVVLLDILQRDNQLLDSIQVDFLTMIRRLKEGGRGIQITCFFEELPFPIVGKVVTQESATLDGYEIYSIYANHRDMVRFGSEEDPGFKRLLWQLHNWTSQVDADDRACIRDLQTTDPRDDKTRIEATKGGLLRESYRWIFNNDKFLDWKLPEKGPKLLWIDGDPGKGKTMLVCGILDEISPDSEGVICFFFCQATDTRLNSASAVLQGLLSMLIEQEPSLISHVRGRYDVSGKRLFDGPNSWQALSKIFLDVLDHIESACLIVDALDECTTGLSQLLDFITQVASTHTHIKWIVSSRVRPDIKSSMDMIPANKIIELKLDDKCISDAVKIFIKRKVQQLAKLKKYTQQIFDAVYSHLIQNAQDTFLWVALVCEKLGQVPRLKTIERLTAFPSGLDALYRGMLQQVCEQEDAAVYKSILATIATLERPVSIAELVPFIDVHCDLLDDDYESVEEMIGYCGSFLKIVQKTIFFVHQSAKEYLLEKGANYLLPNGVASQHRILFLQSIKAIHETVRRDNWGLKSPGVSINHAHARKPHPDPLERVGYSCVHWIDHLLYCQLGSLNQDSFNDGGRISEFLSQKFLHWLEALGLLGQIPKGLAAILKLESLLNTSMTQDAYHLSNRVHDARRFIQYFGLVIEENPLQVYFSPLVFSPSQSMTKVTFQDEAPDWIITEPGVTAWGPCLQTLEGHNYGINFLSQSPDNSRYLSSSMDGAIKLWDLNTGGCTLQLDGHREEISSVLWSQDGSSLVSASHDKTIKVWDLSSGKCTSTLEEHSEWVTSLSWSPDGKNVISVSDDGSAKIWDPASGCCTKTVVGEADVKLSVLWPLSETTRLITVKKDDEIKVMDLATGKYIATLEESIKDIDSIMGLGDGFRLILTASHSRQIMWNFSTGNIIPLHEEGFKYNLSLRKLSFDEKQLASSIGFDISIWDLSLGQRISTLSGHLGVVQSMVWFHDGRIASSSSERDIKIWDSCSGQCLSTLKGHHESVRSLLLSHDESRLISASIDKTLKIWNLDLQERHEGSDCEIDSVIKSHDARFFGVVSDHWVKILDSATGKCVSIFQAGDDYILQASWCQNDLLAIALRDDMVIRLWNPNNNKLGLEFTFDTQVSPKSISGSLDGKLLSSICHMGPNKNITQMWDSITGECLYSASLEAAETKMVGTNITWSPNGKRFASVSVGELINICDATTGQLESHLQGHQNPDRPKKAWQVNKHGLIQDPFSGQWISVMGSYSIWNKIVQNTFLSWSMDGKWLASASLQTTKIWDAATGHCVLTLDIGRHAGKIEFSRLEPGSLDTSIGSFDLDPYLSTPAPAAGHLLARPQPQGYGLSDDYTWITWSGVNLLWLPPDYRPDSFKQTSIHGNTVVIGCMKGQVLALKFTREGPF
ncbi:hypothetical protein N7478_008645 [Penicillium angulare]|uniref:uncharacterized protein n=1 Tax=Penicillium angulare TaxID=116970 RepID=UPI00254260B5|nr:uncharacterized protein N7478_008645 [Penicillium angulare]KAJ5273520.1 hypothetical protein N7478_008645 [Penicillium angulare]